MKPTTFVGIALDSGLYRMDRHESGGIPALLTFPADEKGTEMLKRYIAALEGPVRLAIVTSAATIGLALALGQPPEREIFLVSAQTADHPAELARFAARPI